MAQSATVPAPATILLVTGAPASGKSTVGRAVARLAHRGVFLDGDTFWQAVVAGRADMGEHPTAEALEQLHLRYRVLGTAARVYVEAGFTTVIADNVYGDHLRVVRAAVAPVRLLTVALIPSPEVIAARERGRGSAAYEAWLPGGRGLLDAVRTFSGWVHGTAADLHHDSTGETPDETAAAVRAWVAATA